MAGGVQENVNRYNFWDILGGGKGGGGKRGHHVGKNVRLGWVGTRTEMKRGHPQTPLLAHRKKKDAHREKTSLKKKKSGMEGR